MPRFAAQLPPSTPRCCPLHTGGGGAKCPSHLHPAWRPREGPFCAIYRTFFTAAFPLPAHASRPRDKANFAGGEAKKESFGSFPTAPRWACLTRSKITAKFSSATAIVFIRPFANLFAALKTSSYVVLAKPGSQPRLIGQPPATARDPARWLSHFASSLNLDVGGKNDWQFRSVPYATPTKIWWKFILISKSREPPKAV